MIKVGRPEGLDDVRVKVVPGTGTVDRDSKLARAWRFIPPYVKVWNDDCVIRDPAAPLTALCTIYVDDLETETAVSATLSVPVEFVDSVNDALDPISDPAATAAMRRAFYMAWGVNGPQMYPGYHVFTVFDRKLAPELADVSSAVAIDLVRNDTVLATARGHARCFVAFTFVLWCTDKPGHREAHQQPADWLLPFRVPPAWEREFSDPEAVKHWQIRVRGDGEMALTDWAYDKYWSGEFTVPLEEIIVNGE
ncbi:MAG: hypothetical protein JXO22_15515 [Phycisphaerae bacterium]|nr:hypothetical protein [Phycisphaerae bacterium]